MRRCFRSPCQPYSRFISMMLAVATAVAAWASGYDNLLFSKIDNSEDPRIRSILHLPDGRPAFSTEAGVDIFDGSRFKSLDKHKGDTYPLPLYDGHHHLYTSHGGKYLWIKTNRSLQCVMLDTETYATDIKAIFKEIGAPEKVEDIFSDSLGRLWSVAGTRLSLIATPFSFDLDPGHGALLDIAADADRLYLFFSSGISVCVDMHSGNEIYSAEAYPEAERSKYFSTSLLIDGGNAFYQIRNGIDGGHLLRLDKDEREWTSLLNSALRFNTMAMSDSSLLITTPEGLINHSIADGTTAHIPYLRTIAGNLIASELCTIASDLNGGIWIGTIRNGIYHYNPYLYRYLSVEKPRRSSREPEPHVFSENQDGSVRISANGICADIHLSDSDDSRIDITDAPDSQSSSGVYGTGASFVSSKGAVFFDDPDRYSIYAPNHSIRPARHSLPFISGILVNAVRLEPSIGGGADAVIDKIPSRTEAITLPHYRNFITFEVTSPDMSDPTPEYMFMMEGIDHGWRKAGSADIKDRMLTTTYTALPPGEYTFKTRSTDDADSPEASLRITVSPPWWAHPAALLTYAVILSLLLWGASKAYLKRMRTKIEARQREEALLEKIRQLIEEVDRYKAESPAPADTDKGPSEPQLSEDEKRFVAKAVEFVERNLDTPGYSVVQLSADLCMDRTGLYRKLTALLDQSPSLFIRDIRLRKAAALLREGRMSVTEIAEATGFSSTSYMSKCFQERYGCRPSEYPPSGG